MTDIKSIHNACFDAIGGGKSPAVKSYRDTRNAQLTRDAFFDRTRWAILVSGIKRTVADAVLQRSLSSCSLLQQWEPLAQWSDARFSAFTNCMSSRPHGAKKWSAIRSVAHWLNELGSNEALQQAVFAGKEVGGELNGDDVARLRQLRLPFVGPANSQYIVRMLGGEIIKDDRFVAAFREWRGWNYNELVRAVDNAGVPPGEWDTVLWQYCETYVKQAKNLPEHFSRKFGGDAASI